MKNITDEPAYQDNEVGRGHWHKYIRCSNGEIVYGYHPTSKIDAELIAQREFEEKEAFLALSPQEMIKTIMAKYKDNDYPCAYDMGHLFRCFSKIILKEY